MLLHMVESPRPIDGTAHPPRRYFAIGDVDNLAVFALEYVHNGSFAQAAGVMRLSAGRGIERGVLERYPPVGGRAISTLALGAGSHLVTCASNSRRKESR